MSKRNVKRSTTVGVDRWTGGWNVEQFEVIRVTDTKIVVQYGGEERRFNRQTGRTCNPSDGLSSMADPNIRKEDLEKLEAQLKKDGLFLP